MMIVEEADHRNPMTPESRGAQIVTRSRFSSNKLFLDTVK
jgi:hypothetical protein